MERRNFAANKKASPIKLSARLLDAELGSQQDAVGAIATQQWRD